MKWLSRLFAYLSDRTTRDMGTALRIVESAMPIVRSIAAMTPTRSDDELIRLFEQFSIPGVQTWLQLSPSQRGRALMNVAAIQLKRISPDSVDRIIDLAVQIAVVKMKGEGL